MSFTSVSLACISLIFGYTVLTQSFPGGCDDLAIALILLLNPIFCWSFLWLQSQEGQDTDVAEKKERKKRMVLLSGYKPLHWKNGKNTTTAAYGLETAG